MTDARTLSLKSNLQLDNRIVHCNCQTSYSGDTLSQLAATIFLPGGELQGVNTAIHYRCEGDASNYTVELRDVTGTLVRASRVLDNVPFTEWYVPLDTDYSVPANGAWYTVYITAPSFGDPIYFRGILFAIGGTFPPAPTNVVAPTISGTVEIGQTLTTTDGTWTSDVPYTISYQWRRDGVDISGAVFATYDVTFADIGPSLECLVSATNTGGPTSVASNALIFDDATYLPDTAVWANPLTGNGMTTADGDTTVDVWASQWGGVACTLAAPAATHRPAYSLGGVGGRPILTFDGTDDFLRGSFTKGSAFDDQECGIVGERVTFSVLGDIWFGYWFPNSAGFYLNDQDATRFRFTSLGAANVTPSSTYDPTGVLAHYSGEGIVGEINVRVAGVTVATTVASPVSRADGNTVIMGASQTSTVGPYGTTAANVIIHGAHLGPALTADQRLHLRALLSHHTGVAC